MRTLTIAVAAAAVLLSLACREEPELASPFTFFGRPDMRAGIRYSVMDEAANRESIGKFVCKELWADGKRCQAMIDPGTLIATVNGKGRVVHLKIETPRTMRGSSYDQRTQARIDFAKSEFSRMRDAWSLVNPPDVSARTRGSAEFHWVDNQSRWTGAMWYGSLYTYLPKSWQQDMQKYQDTLAYLPDSVVAIDEFAFEEFLKLQPADQGDRVARKGPPDAPLERLQFDLAMVASAQEEHLEDHGTYATTPDALIFLAGDGVRIEIRDATRGGWAALGTHDLVPGVTCVIHGGTVAAPPSTPKGVTPAAGQVACDTAQ